MVTVTVDLKDRAYDIVIGQGSLSGLGEALIPLKLGGHAVVITNPVVKKLHGRRLAAGLRKKGFTVRFIEVPDGEKSKSAQTAFSVIEQIARKDAKKSCFIVAFGGGVIGDLAGYVAAAYKRGIPYVQVPTTLLAQVDSAIGGKVGVDLPFGKNLIGAFYQPKLVWSDVEVLKTLDRRQIRNGLAEVIKYGIICNKSLFLYVQRHVDQLLGCDPRVLQEVVHSCSRIKAKVVLSDELETLGMRTILNFGHTVGHAIEAANQFKDYHHGEAVALGMHVAAEISCQLGLLKEESRVLMGEALDAIGLPRVIKKVSPARIMRVMDQDKKFVAGRNKFVLITDIGKVKVVEGIDRSVILKAVGKFKK